MKTQDTLKEGSRKLNSMLEEMEQKQVRPNESECEFGTIYWGSTELLTSPPHLYTHGTNVCFFSQERSRCCNRTAENQEWRVGEHS